MAAVTVGRGWLARAARAVFKAPNGVIRTRYSSSGNAEEKTSTDIVNISESCVKRLQELGENTSLRVGVEGGGCSGFQYTFELDSPVEDGDKVFARGNVSVIIDQTSLEYLKGSTIEFHHELIRSAFRVVSNPLAGQGCSCGASFNVKID